MNMNLNELIEIKSKSSFFKGSQDVFERKRRIYYEQDCSSKGPFHHADRLKTSRFKGFYSPYHMTMNKSKIYKWKRRDFKGDQKSAIQHDGGVAPTSHVAKPNASFINNIHSSLLHQGRCK